jgi:hypothetical protein
MTAVGVRGLLFISALALASCTPGEAERVSETAAGQAEPAVVAEDRSVSGLRLPVAGEVFSIGDERWKVEAISIAFPKEPVQEDTQILDVTVQARRLGAAAPEYLGQGTAPEVD